MFPSLQSDPKSREEPEKRVDSLKKSMPVIEPDPDLEKQASAKRDLK